MDYATSSARQPRLRSGNSPFPARGRQTKITGSTVSVLMTTRTAAGQRDRRRPGVDAIQEFSVLTGGFSAEYGKASGGVVNAITKSGTNGFHGDVYEFLRNSALDSRDTSRGAATLHWPF